jgi:hypothetical protein
MNNRRQFCPCICLIFKCRRSQGFLYDCRGQPGVNAPCAYSVTRRCRVLGTKRKSCARQSTTGFDPEPTLAGARSAAVARCTVVCYLGGQHRSGGPVSKQPNSIAFLQVADETFDIGVDTRTSVNEQDYQVPFPFNGTIDKLTFKLGPLQFSEADKRKAAEAVTKARD